MGATRTPAVTGLSELSNQLQHPSAEAIWSRAVEIFGGEELARKWMEAPLPILDRHTPRSYTASGDAAQQREVLMILNRIDFGMFS
jgi:uncharacterized protein (DUF2384 family)